MEKKNKKWLKIFGTGAFCAVLATAIVLPCTLVSAQAKPASPQDDVIFTTSYGLDIHFNNDITAGEFPYFHAGDWDWWIIGASPAYFLDEGTSPAGQAIAAEASRDVLYGGKYYSFIDQTISTNMTITFNEEIPGGCVLCLCEDLIKIDEVESDYKTTTYWASTSSGSCNAYFDKNSSCRDQYGDTGCALKKVVDSYYKNKLKGTTVGNNIQKVTTLNTYYYASRYEEDIINMASTAGDTYLFPLAYGETGFTLAESFCIGTYMDTNALRKAYPTGTTGTANNWWLRSGCGTSSYASARVVDYNGNITNAYVNMGGYGVRPAFILKI